MSARRTPRRLAVAALALLLPLALAPALAPSLAAGASADDPRDATADTSTRARTIALRVLPPIAQPGRTPTAPRRGKLLVARLAPVSGGVALTVQRSTKSGWLAGRTVRTDALGYALFPVKRGGTYRVVGGGSASETLDAVVRKPDFRDTFGGRTLDRKIWRTEDLGYNPTGLRTCAKPGPAYSVRGGTVRLGIRRDPKRKRPCLYSTPKIPIGKAPYLLNTQLVTEDRYEFTHGIVAMRVKFQPARGSHSGMWIQSWRYRKPGKPARGVEVDMAEYFGRGGNVDALGAFVHTTTRGGSAVRMGDLLPQTRRLLPRGHTFWNSFHVVSLEWTPTRYVFRLDGRVYWTVNRWVSQVPQYLVLSNLTSDYELKNLTKASFATPAYVDWVQVWETPGG